MTAALLVKRYEALSLRERALVVFAVLGLLIAAWDTLLMDPLRRTRGALTAELDTAGTFGAAAQSADASDPRQISIRRVGELQTQLHEIDAQLANTASGFVASSRMIEVLHDMLDRQGRLVLVSIRNLQVTSLIPPAEATTDGGADAATAAQPQPPYVHAIEIVIDGEYGDILDYLSALEALPWKFRWTSLDLSTAGYPRNRVRIQLSTLSLESTWLGV
jgi:MSHA biogenesis protein MshJ